MISRAIDYLLTRKEVDDTRLAIHGTGLGAYWATKLSILERNRLRAVSVQSPPLHAFFQTSFLMNSVLHNNELLFDRGPALMATFEDAATLKHLAAVFPRMSLVHQDLLSRPTTPMLVVAGVQDTQVPISDIHLLLDSGDVPKAAWINPKGGHLGRQGKLWPDAAIFRQIVMPWLVRTLESTRTPNRA